MLASIISLLILLLHCSIYVSSIKTSLSSKSFDVGSTTSTSTTYNFKKISDLAERINKSWFRL